MNKIRVGKGGDCGADNLFFPIAQHGPEDFVDLHNLQVGCNDLIAQLGLVEDGFEPGLTLCVPFFQIYLLFQFDNFYFSRFFFCFQIWFSPFSWLILPGFF